MNLHWTVGVSVDLAHTSAFGHICTQAAACAESTVRTHRLRCQRDLHFLDPLPTSSARSSRAISKPEIIHDLPTTKTMSAGGEGGARTAMKTMFALASSVAASSALSSMPTLMNFAAHSIAASCAGDVNDLHAISRPQGPSRAALNGDVIFYYIEMF